MNKIIAIAPSAEPAADMGAAASALERPLGRAEGLPGSFYGAAAYETERKTLFVNSWVAVAMGAQIPEPGDVLPVDVAGWPLLLVRSPQGEVKAFFNLCRHRAMKLVTEACSAQKVLRCPWHSWTYGLDGQMLLMPEVGGDRISEAEGFDKSALGLKPVRVGRWLDYVFVNLDDSAPDFDQHIAPMNELLANYQLDGLRRFDSIEHRYAGNWKVVIESGLEDYHLPFGHPQLNARLLRNSTPRIFPGVYCGVSTDTSTLPDDADTRAWTAQLPDLPRHRTESAPDLYAMAVFPTAGLLVAADHLALSIVLPDGPGHTKVCVHLYTHGDAADAPDQTEARQLVSAMWHEVLVQDGPFIEGVQEGLNARDYAGVSTRFSPYWEAGVHAFQTMTLAAVRQV